VVFLSRQFPRLQFYDFCFFPQFSMAPSTPTSSNGTTNIAQRTFTLSPSSSSTSSSEGRGSSNNPRAGRRIHVPAEVLKSCRIGANDPLLLASALTPGEIQKRLKIRQGKEVGSGGAEEKVNCFLYLQWKVFAAEANTDIPDGPCELEGRA